MATECSRDLFGSEVVEGRRVVATFDGGEATSDAGARWLGAADRAIGLVARFATCLPTAVPRHRSSTALRPWWRSVFGVALGYEELVDHDQLRYDPVLATLAGKLEAKRQNCARLAGKSSLNRLEHAPAGPSRYHKISHDPVAIEGLFVDLFLERTRHRRASLANVLAILVSLARSHRSPPRDQARQHVARARQASEA